MPPRGRARIIFSAAEEFHCVILFTGVIALGTVNPHEDADSIERDVPFDY